MDRLFLFVYGVLLLLLNVIVGIFLISWDYIPSMIYYVTMELFNVQFVYTLTEIMLSLLVKRDHDLPALESLTEVPPVALLYLTCDDINPKIVETLAHQTYPNCYVFILDNSTLPEYQAAVDRCGLRVLRHASARHSKAANLNNWLVRYSPKYPYFVILDSDSILPPDFVIRMLHYAEHPLNRQVAIFQSETRTWNTGNRFARIMAAVEPLWYFPLKRLANRCNMLLPWGHNQICRTSAIRAAGDFTDVSMSEDYEVAVRLLQIGFSSKLVNVTSWDAMPEDLDAYAKRTVRWAQGIIQVARRDIAGVPLIVKFRLFMTVYFYLVQVFYVVALLLIVWSYQSTLHNVYALGRFLVTGAFLQTTFWQPLAVIGMYLSFYLLLQPLLAYRLGVSLRQYMAHTVVTVAIGIYTVVPLARGMWSAWRTGKGTRTVMPKPGQQVPISQASRSWLMGVALSGVMLTGVMRNPVVLVFNFFWLLPFIASPLIIHQFRRPAAVTGVDTEIARIYPQLL